MNEIKEAEYQKTKSERIEKSLSWKIYYKVDGFLERIANWGVKEGTEAKIAIVTYIFVLLDIFTTHLFLYFELGMEGNPFVRSFYDVGLIWQFEVMKLLLMAFAIGFGYMVSTRGWTSAEKGGGKMVLFLSYVMFGTVVVWNITMILLTLTLERFI